MKTPALDDSAHTMDTTSDKATTQVDVYTHDSTKALEVQTTSVELASASSEKQSSNRVKMVNRAAVNATTFQELSLATGVCRWYLDNDRTASMIYTASDKDKSRVNLVMDCFNKYLRSHTKEFHEVNAFNNIDLSSSQYTESRNRANKILQDLCAQFQTTLLQYEAEIKLQKTQHSSSSSSTTVSSLNGQICP